MLYVGGLVSQVLYCFFHSTRRLDNDGNLFPLFVSNFQVNEEILHAAFIPFGEIRSVDIPKDYAHGKYSSQ